MSALSSDALASERYTCGGEYDMPAVIAFTCVVESDTFADRTCTPAAESYTPGGEIVMLGVTRVT
jgi:hypothetical protein